jgi:hypothetical protein
MKKNIIFSICFVFLMIFLSETLSAQSVALVLKVKGDVSFTRGTQATKQKMRRGLRLVDGDKIATGRKSYAAVRFADDASLVRVRSNSTCTIKAKKEQDKILKNVYLEVGTLFARVTKQRGKFEISTPTSVASVKGSACIVDQPDPESGNPTLYHGLEGQWEVSNDAGSALLTAGQTVVVPDKNTAPYSRPTQPGELDGEGDENIDDFEFEFQNENGERRILRFGVQKEE